MWNVVLLSFALLGAPGGLNEGQPPQADPDQYPLALHRSMEIDDLDREILRLHDTVVMLRAKHASTKRLAQRGLVSRSDEERENSELQYQQAREEESIAYRALKRYERDVLGQVLPLDELKMYHLMLDLARRQIEIARIEVSHREFSLNQTRALLQRRSVSREEAQEAELAHESAEAGLALYRSREAQVLMEIAARAGSKPYDPAQAHALQQAYLEARVRHFELNAKSARHRREIAKERARLGLLPADDLLLHEKAESDAVADLATARKVLEKHRASPPAKTQPLDRSRISRGPCTAAQARLQS